MSWVFASFADRLPVPISCVTSTRDFRWVCCADESGRFTLVDAVKSLNGEALHSSDELAMPCKLAWYVVHRWSAASDPTRIAMHKEGVFLLAGTKTGDIQLWGLRVHDFTNVYSAKLNKAAISGLALTDNDTAAVAVSQQGGLSRIDLNTGALLPVRAAQHNGIVTNMAYTDNTALTCSLDGTCKLWDVRATGAGDTTDASMTVHDEEARWILDTVWHPDGHRFSHVDRNSRVTVWDRRNASAPVHSRRIGRRAAPAFCVAGNDTHMAVGTALEGVHVLDWELKPAARLACASAVASVALSRDSRFAFTGCGTGGWPMLLPHGHAIDTHHAVAAGFDMTAALGLKKGGRERTLSMEEVARGQAKHRAYEQLYLSPTYTKRQQQQQQEQGGDGWGDDVVEARSGADEEEEEEEQGQGNGEGGACKHSLQATASTTTKGMDGGNAVATTATAPAAATSEGGSSASGGGYVVPDDDDAPLVKRPKPMVASASTHAHGHGHGHGGASGPFFHHGEGQPAVSLGGDTVAPATSVTPSTTTTTATTVSDLHMFGGFHDDTTQESDMLGFGDGSRGSSVMGHAVHTHGEHDVASMHAHMSEHSHNSDIFAGLDDNSSNLHSNHAMDTDHGATLPPAHTHMFTHGDNNGDDHGDGNNGDASFGGSLFGHATGRHALGSGSSGSRSPAVPDALAPDFDMLG